ncbi:MULTISPECIES: hypothetical protein [Pseudomonas]|uniref:Uncharacterized protein n=1 Tax=Pseudomonas fluorescens TaxID=294 RepID=A0A7Z6QMK8_PSEFL|nr:MULTISPECIES: hypothetical protein [Pseudomonas]QDG59537.1 hypothetical protein NIBR502773_24365 [Pseudomonas sp. NIBRBAC000502773]RDS88686.1 hypothetical protein DL347_23395 [Pseudomonas fluorescens]
MDVNNSSGSNQYNTGYAQANGPAGSQSSTGQQGHASISAPTGNTGRAPGDHRSVDAITNTPLFASAREALKDDKLTGIKSQTGDWDDMNASNDTRADRAANAERVFQYADAKGGTESTPNNNQIEGTLYTRPMTASASSDSSYDYVKGSEANTLYNFEQNGYKAFAQ